MSTASWLSRRTALKGLVATGVGLVAGRDRLRRRDRTPSRPARSNVAAGDWAAAGARRPPHRSHHGRALQRRWCRAEDIAVAVDLLREARPDVVALGGDYVTECDVTRAVPVAELLAPLAGAPHGRLRGPRQSRRRSRGAGGVGGRGFTVLRDQRTRMMLRGEAMDIVGLRYLDAAAAGDHPGGEGCRPDHHHARPRSAPPARGRHARRATGPRRPHPWRPGRAARHRRRGGAAFPGGFGREAPTATARCSSAAASAPCSCRCALTARPRCQCWCCEPARRVVSW